MKIIFLCSPVLLYTIFLLSPSLSTAQCPHTHIYINATKYFGHSGDDKAWRIIPIDDGDPDAIPNNGYIVVGSAYMGATGTDAFILRLDANLDSVWGKTFDGGAATPQADAAYSVVQTNSGLLMVCGVVKTKHFGTNYNQNVWVIKMKLNGDTLWKKQYGSDKTDAAYDIKQDHDGNFVVVGTATAANNDLAGDTVDHVGDIWVLKIDTNGAILRQQVFHGPNYVIGGDPDAAHSVVVDCAGKYVLSSSCSTCGKGDTTMQNLLIKMPSDLSSDSSVVLGKLMYSSDHPSYSIIQAYSGIFGTCSNSDPYVCNGISHYSGGCLQSAHDYWVSKTNHDLTDNSTFTNSCFDVDEGAVYGGTQGDDGWSVAQGCDGYLVAGFTKSGNSDNNVSCNNDPTSPYKEDAWIAKISSYDGSFMWDESLGDTSNDGAYYITRVYDGSFIMAGYASAPAVPISKGYDFFIVKFEDTTAACSKPAGLSRTVQTANCRVIFRWTASPCVPGYILKYKTVGAATWTTVDPAPNPSLLNLPAGNYVWTVQAKCTQHKISDTTRGMPFQIPNGCLKIGNENADGQENSLSVYPNPSDGSFEISLALDNYSGPATLELLDQVGQVISSSRGLIENGLLQRKIFSPLPSGYYWVKVIAGDRSFTTKLIIQRD